MREWHDVHQQHMRAAKELACKTLRATGEEARMARRRYCTYDPVRGTGYAALTRVLLARYMSGDVVTR